MRRALAILIIVAIVLAVLLVNLPSPTRPAVASIAPAPTLANTDVVTKTFVAAQPTADVVAVAVATVPPTAAQGVQPTTEPPHVVVVAPNEPQTEPQTVAQQGSASEERARLMRAELTLTTQYGLHVNFKQCNEYTVRNREGVGVDPSPLDRLIISDICNNQR